MATERFVSRQERWGKSTIAAALHVKGYDLVTDDVRRSNRSGGPSVSRLSSVKLWPQAARLLGEIPERLPPCIRSIDKRGWRAERGFFARASPARAHLRAGGRSGTGHRASAAREACFELLGHWYAIGSVVASCRTAPRRHLRHAPRWRVRSRCSVGSIGWVDDAPTPADLVDEDLRR